MYKDKPGGLVVVDYLVLADQLNRTLADYMESDGTGMRYAEKCGRQCLKR